ncbi:MAG: hypothetical protein M9952_07890 [Microthrixaceae bacterium]|nr:hypothetical protein [Microthrixaceae bacterium]
MADADRPHPTSPPDEPVERSDRSLALDAVDGPGRARRGTLDPVRWTMVVLIALVVGLGAAASIRGWIPVGDNAFLSYRSRHVGSSDPILLNNASSGGTDNSEPYNHPGAFPLTLMAPITLIGGPGSVPLAAAVCTAASIGLISSTVRRVAGRGAQLWSLVVSAGLLATQSVTMFADPWNPNFAMWPLGLAVIAAWAACQGHRWSLAVAGLAASVAVQSHLAFIAPGAAAFAAGLAGTAIVWRRDSRRLRVELAATAIALSVANAQLLVDQFFGTGNLGRLLSARDAGAQRVSVHDVGAVLVSKLSPSVFRRDGWFAPVFPADRASPVAIVVGLGALAVLSIAAVAFSRSADDLDLAVDVDSTSPHRRNHRRLLATLFGIVGVTVVAGSVLALRYPMRIGIPLPYFRWVWPLGAILTGALAASAVRIGSERLAAPRGGRVTTGGRWPLAFGAASVMVLTGVSGVPIGEEMSPNPQRYQDLAGPLSSAAIEALTRFDDGPIGSVFVEQSHLQAGLWVIPALIDQLDAAGIDVAVSDPILDQQTGGRLTSDSAPHTQFRLILRGGLDSTDDLESNPGALRLATPVELADREIDEFHRLVDALAPVISDGANFRADADIVDAEGLALVESLRTDPPDPQYFFSAPSIRDAWQQGWLVIDGADRDDLERAFELGTRLGAMSVTLWLVAPDG